MSDRLTTTPRASFAGNAAWLLVGQVLSKVASFVFFIFVARALGTSDYGFFNFAISFAPLFLMIATLGLDAALIRELAADPAKMRILFPSALIIRFGLGTLALGAAVAVGPLFLDSGEGLATLAIVGFALLLDEIVTLMSSVFKAFEQMRFYALFVVVNRLVSTALALLALLLGRGLLFVSVAYLLGSAAALLFAGVTLRSQFPGTRLRDAQRDTISLLFRSGLTLGVAHMLNMALFRLDTVMVQAIAGATAVAYYGVAYRFFESFLFIAWSFANLALPRVARFGRGASTSRTYQLSIALTLAAYLPVAAGALFAAEAVVVTLFGDRYAEAAEAVPWLSAAAVFYGIAHISRVALVGLDHKRVIVRVAALTLGVNVGANLILIPQIGFVGAAVATCLAEVIEALLLAVALRRANGVALAGPVMFVPVVAAAVMAIVLWWTGLRDLPAVLAGAAVYPICVALAARLLAPDDARLAGAKIAGAFRRRAAA